MVWSVWPSWVVAGDHAVEAFAAGVAGLEAEHVAFEFTDAADVFFEDHLEEGFDLLLLLVHAGGEVLVLLHHHAEGAADVGVGDRGDVDIGERTAMGRTAIGHTETSGQKDVRRTFTRGWRIPRVVRREMHDSARADSR